MAEEESTDEEGQGEQESNLGAPGGAPQEEHKSRKMLIIIAVAALFLMIVIAALFIFLFVLDDEQAGIRGTAEEAEFVELYNKRMQTSLDPVKDPIYTEPFSYSVNMKNGLNYIHLTIIAVVNDPLAKTYLETRTPLIDDTLINLLRSKFPKDIQTRIGLELLKQEIFLEFNKLFPQEYIDQSLSKDRMPVKDILFTEFYIQ